MPAWAKALGRAACCGFAGGAGSTRSWQRAARSSNGRSGAARSGSSAQTAFHGAALVVAADRKRAQRFVADVGCSDPKTIDVSALHLIAIARSRAVLRRPVRRRTAGVRLAGGGRQEQRHAYTESPREPLIDHRPSA